MKRWLIAALLMALVAAVWWKKNPASRVVRGTAMGCQWTLQWRGEAPPPRDLERAAAEVLETWEQVLSQWRPHSDLSRFNRGEPATPELARVIALAEEIKAATGGAFDPYLLEKVHAAGFGPEGSGLDLSSIGKGFAVDRVSEHLTSLGVRDFIFSLAGEVRAVGGEWPVVVEKPDPSSSVAARTFLLKDRSIATSGNYRQFRTTARGIVSHIIDPRTGEPVIRPFSSVAVIAPDCATASAWATALFVLGPDDVDLPPSSRSYWQP